MNVKHGTVFEVRLMAGRRLLQRDQVQAQDLGAHYTVLSYCYGGAFGQANWHDGTGRPLPRAPRMVTTLMNPADELTAGELCDCDTCIPTE